MDVSVIIPSYNRLSFLEEAVASVLNQTVSPLEILIVDDGSTDGTWEWLQTLAPEKFRTFHRDNQGPGPARNFAVGQARGKWIAFLDSDDWWQENKLAVQLEYLRAHPEYKICQTEEVWIRNGVRVNPRRVHRKYSGFIFEQCLPLCIISPSAVMMEREFFLELGGFDETFPVCEDYELWLRATLRSPVATLPQALTVKQGGHPDQLSKKHWGMDRFRVQAMEKVLREEILTAKQREAVSIELGKKLNVLAQGFSKRHPGEVNPYIEPI